MAETENHSNDIESGAPFMKCEGFAQITDLMDYLDNNRLIAHYCDKGYDVKSIYNTVNRMTIL